MANEIVQVSYESEIEELTVEEELARFESALENADYRAGMIRDLKALAGAADQAIKFATRRRQAIEAQIDFHRRVLAEVVKSVGKISAPLYTAYLSKPRARRILTSEGQSEIKSLGIISKSIEDAYKAGDMVSVTKLLKNCRLESPFAQISVKLTATANSIHEHLGEADNLTEEAEQEPVFNLRLD